MKYKVNLIVEVNAFDEDDSFDMLMETFGIGENAPGIKVLECEWTYTK